LPPDRRLAVWRCVAPGVTTASIVDPGLAGTHGHNYSALLRLKAELSKLGIEHDCFASVQADAAVREHAMPVLPQKGLWWRVQKDPNEFLAHSAEMARQLSFALAEQERPADLLVLPCCDAVQVLALAVILRRMNPLRAPHIVMWLLFPELQDEYRGAFVALKQAIGDERKIAVYCETASMAATFSGLIGLEVGIAPCANLAGACGKRRSRAREGAPKIVSMGVCNAAKGYHLLPGAIGRVLQSTDDVAFLIHGVLPRSDVDNREMFEALSKMGRRVQVSNKVLTSDEYLSYLLQADLLLLPYDETVYGVRGSGVFNEARELGIPVVATRSCSFARPAFDQGWGVEIAERSAGGVAEAVLAAVSRLPELTARASAAANVAPDGIATVLREAVDRVNRQQRSLETDARSQAGWDLPVAHPLSSSLFSRIALRNGAAGRGSAPMVIRKLTSWWSSSRQLSLLTNAVIETSTVPFHYSVLLHVDRAVTRHLEPGSMLIVEMLIEVFTGEIGVVWLDEGGQPLQDSERYALATPGLQRVIVSISVDRARCLVIRNVANDSTAASFRVSQAKAWSIVEAQPWEAQALAAGAQ
jgi:glycosyltransferase involved in cell wall biosynthesis